MQLSLSENITELSIKVIPRAKKTEYIGTMADGSYKIRLKAVPEDGKANEELLHFLERETRKRWEIIG